MRLASDAKRPIKRRRINFRIVKTPRPILRSTINTQCYAVRRLASLRA